MTRIPPLEPDQVRLLLDTRAGKVARHRTGYGRSPALGDDYQADPSHGPGGLRRAGARIKVLAAAGLVELPARADNDVTWPWKTTAAGDAVLAELAQQAETAPADEPGEPAGASTSAQLHTAQARVEVLESVLRRILVTYTQPPTSGQEALRVSYVEKRAVDRWQAVLEGRVTSA